MLDPIGVAVGEMNPCAGGIQELEVLVLQAQRLIPESDVPSRIDESAPPQHIIVPMPENRPIGDEIGSAADGWRQAPGEWRRTTEEPVPDSRFEPAASGFR